ncbi:DUF3310 domain-containing protein [Mitsuokella jalaludinii]|uniref:DUF3310 domain-containing protein n=1 Tax=Mitsuokella jalaludinii TaxID=187979 RepID=UPI001D00E8AD|nr:DUF3310 domain-containing protein [Mitsuokella jalaludinii]MCB5724452.1 DUF3310 domain-containing protein [Mitsuokella jalaludinii]
MVKERMIAMINMIKELNDIYEQVDFAAFQACGAVDDNCENCVFDSVDYCLFSEIQGAIAELILNMRTEDKKTPGNAINHPDHYNRGIEVIDFIESHELNFNRGNAVKYLTRAGLKDKDKEAEDLEKAKWYIDRELERIKKEKNHEAHV